MKKSILIICILGFIVLENFAQSVLTNDERKSIKESVEQKSKEFWKLFTQDYNEQNLNRLMDFYVDTDDEVWMGKPAIETGESEIIYTKDELKEALSLPFKNRHSTPTKTIENYFAVISNDVVIEILTHEYYVIANNGYRGPDTEGGLTIIWVLRNNEWKILHRHRSGRKKNE